MDYSEKSTALLVSSPGIIQDATTAMLNSFPQVRRVEIASGVLSAIDHLRDGYSNLLVIDANLPDEEVASLVRWSKQHRPNTRCIVLVKGMVELERAHSAGADAVFLRSSSASQLSQALWPSDQT